MNNIKKRFIASLSTNLFRGSTTLLTGVLLARFMGSEDYGLLVFLIATSMAIKQLLDFGSSSAFFTFLSQESRSVKFIAQFCTFFFAKYIVTIVIIFWVIPGSWLANIWLGNSSNIVVIAILAVAFQSDFWNIVSQLLESQRMTIRVQVLFVITQLTQIGFIFGLHYLKILTIANYLITLGMLWIVVSLIAAYSYRPLKDSNIYKNKTVTVMSYIKYCLPIAPIILINFIADFLDRWMLQNWGGSAQQAYFAVSVQIASVSLLFTASFIKIFWKEVAEALYKGNTQNASILYLKARKIIFYSGMFIAAGCIPWTTEILRLMYGDSYNMATLPLVILFLYSIHQSIGQVDSAFLMASGKTHVGFKTIVVLAPLGMLISYSLIADSGRLLLDLDLGATGLAAKMFIAQLISVNVIGYLIQKEFGLKFSYFYQLQAFVVFSAIGFLPKIFLTLSSPNFAYAFVFGIASYTLLTILIVLRFPGMIGLHKDWLHNLKAYLLTKTFKSI